MGEIGGSKDVRDFHPKVRSRLSGLGKMNLAKSKDGDFPVKFQ